MDSGLQNINTLLAKINQLDGNAKLSLKRSINKEINFVKGEAKLLCPVDTGRLRNSITSTTRKTTTEIVGEVKTNCEYAP